MSRCIRKVEGETFFIVYCNTSDVVFPYMFNDLESAEYFVSCFDRYEKWSIYLKPDGIYSIEDLYRVSK
jgi:hypothetical protein